jgi:hypothetical protein
LYRQNQYRHDFQIVFMVVIEHSAGLGIGKTRTVDLGLEDRIKTVGIAPIRKRTVRLEIEEI